MLLVYSDYIKDLTAGALSITDEDPFFPVENIQNENADIVCKTQSVVAQSLTIDLGASRAPKFFALINHNFSEGDSIYIKVGGDVIATISVTKLDCYILLADAPDAAQTWVFDFTDATISDPLGVGFQLGRVIIAADYDLELAPDDDFKLRRSYEFTNILNTTPHGVKWGYTLAAQINHFRLSWGARSGTTLRTNLRTLYEKVHGNAHPFVFLPNETSGDLIEPVQEIHYVYIGNPILSWTEFFDSVHIGEAELELITAPRARSDVS